MIVEKDVELLQQIFGKGAEIKANEKVISILGNASSANCPPLEGVPEGRGRTINSQVEDSSLCLSTSPSKGRQETPIIGDNSNSYLYIHNPDKTIRWIIPANQNQPYFLHLYNGSGWRGFLIDFYYKIGFKLGLKKWICNGSFEVTDGTEMPKENYAIFTGTKGENRKIIITSGAPNRPSGYLKIPLTGKAKRLTETEGNVLSELNNYNFKTLNIPKTKFVKKGVWVSNVQPEKYKNETAISSSHLNALSELFDKTGQLQKLSDLPAWNDIQNDLNALSTSNIKNDLSPSKVQKLTGLLMKMRNQFSDSDMLPTYQAHGDFTPWNMFTSKGIDRQQSRISKMPDKNCPPLEGDKGEQVALNDCSVKLHLFDWELSERLPALYDLFHFVFQTGILVKKQSYSEIKATIDSILKKPDCQHLIKENNINVKKVYCFYLLRNCSYYLKRYLAQKDLHLQAHWLIDSWLDALEKTVRSKPQTTKVLR